MSERDDLDAPPTPEELLEAERLRASLDRGENTLADAIRAAHSPAPLSPETNDALIDAAVAALPQRKRSNVIRVAFGAATVLAAAAAAVAVVATRSLQPSQSEALSRSRSTEELFDQPFPREGGTSSRIDRIASARQRDLRKNQYARWGVKP